MDEAMNEEFSMEPEHALQTIPFVHLDSSLTLKALGFKQ
jgi:hypothetical protein